MAAPSSGWPLHPVGDVAELEAIAAWLCPSTERRELTYVISDRSDSYRWVYATASWLLRDLRAHEKTSRPAELRDQLQRLIGAAREVTKLIASHPGGNGYLEKTAVESGFMEYDPAIGPPMLQPVSGNDILRKPLHSIIQIATDGIAELEKLKGRPRDSVFMRRFGDPRKLLAARCAKLLRDVGGPKAAPIREGGPVTEFASKVWIYATGTEQGEGFDRICREGARIVRDNPTIPLRLDAKAARKLGLPS
jgi:hypothetical protein